MAPFVLLIGVSTAAFVESRFITSLFVRCKLFRVLEREDWNFHERFETLHLEDDKRGTTTREKPPKRRGRGAVVKTLSFCVEEV